MQEFVGSGHHTLRRRAGRAGPASDAGQQRHLSRLAERVRGPDGVQRDFYVRQLRDWKGSAVVETMNPNVMALYGELCGRTLARAHARSGDRVAIASYLGAKDVFDRAIAEFAELYADQTERDYDPADRRRTGRSDHRSPRPRIVPYFLAAAFASRLAALPVGSMWRRSRSPSSRRC